MNDLKDAFAEAYFFAIAAAAGVSIERTTRRTDNKGIDLTIFQKENNISVGSSVHIQLKGVSDNSSSMIKEYEDHIEYNLVKPLQPTMIHYLIVVKLPSDLNTKNWIKLTEEELTLKRCAYYFRLLPDIKSGFIKIPRSQLLTQDNLLALFPDPRKIAEYI